MGKDNTNIEAGDSHRWDGLCLDRKSINGQTRHAGAGTGEGESNSDRVVTEGSISDKRDGQKVRRASLRLTPTDVLVERVGLRQARCTPPAQRGKITTWSRKSRRGLKLAVRGIEGLTHFVTLTYGVDFPTDPDAIRKHWERVRKWFTRRGFKGVWRREIQERGAIHYHVLIGGADAPDATELGCAWAKITGCADPFRSVYVSPVRNMERVAAYISKIEPQASETIAVGRYWGTFGGAKVAIKAQVIGDAAAVAKLARVARHLERAQRHKARLRPRHDNGMWGRVVWGVAKALHKDLPRLTKLYGLTGRLDAIFASADEADEPAPSALIGDSRDATIRTTGRMGWIMLRAR